MRFTVTFSENVTSANASDFTLTATGSAASASVTTVTPVSGSVYIVAVNTGNSQGNGTLRLDVVDTSDIIDAGGNQIVNLPYTGGEMYDVAKFYLMHMPLVSR